LSTNKVVDGQNILYHYMQSLMQEETQFSKELIEHLLIDLSIWIPNNFYIKLPVILPYVVRDNSCRINTLNGHDEWGSSNSKGYLRDDNTLLKGIVRSFRIRSPNIPAYDGKKLGTGFVASHIWGKVTVDNNFLISSRHHMLNSFVPNLVWLPVQISKLTDREGSYAQRFLQAISCQIYKNIDLPKELDKIWEVLPCPQQVPTIRINLDKINYFDVSNDWLTKRVEGLILEIDTILSVNGKNENSKLEKIKASRYLPALGQTPLQQREELNEWLSKYRSFLDRKLTSVSKK
jgi:hypothetical protein